MEEELKALKTQLEHLTAVIGRLYTQHQLNQLQIARFERVLEEACEVKFGTHVTTGRLGNWREDQIHPNVRGNAVNG